MMANGQSIKVLLHIINMLYSTIMPLNYIKVFKTTISAKLSTKHYIKAKIYTFIVFFNLLFIQHDLLTDLIWPTSIFLCICTH